MAGMVEYSGVTRVQQPSVLTPTIQQQQPELDMDMKTKLVLDRNRSTIYLLVLHHIHPLILQPSMLLNASPA